MAFPVPAPHVRTAKSAPPVATHPDPSGPRQRARTPCLCAARIRAAGAPSGTETTTTSPSARQIHARPPPASATRQGGEAEAVRGVCHSRVSLPSAGSSEATPDASATRTRRVDAASPDSPRPDVEGAQATAAAALTPPGRGQSWTTAHRMPPGGGAPSGGGGPRGAAEPPAERLMKKGCGCGGLGGGGGGGWGSRGWAGGGAALTPPVARGRPRSVRVESSGEGGVASRRRKRGIVSPRSLASRDRALKKSPAASVRPARSCAAFGRRWVTAGRGRTEPRRATRYTSTSDAVFDL